MDRLNRRDLPIFELESALVAALRRESGARVVLQAPTGSGKSTQTPQMLLDNGLLGSGEVVVLQPRRLATRMLAARVAQERGCRLGDEVGFQIRFDKVTSAKTRIRFVTEGVLLRQMLNDPGLRGVSAILFDEFHERHLYGDITLARALELQSTLRPDLKLVVMSATLDTAGLERYLAPCEVLQSEGRTYPVEIRYLPRPVRTDHTGPAVWDLAAEELEKLARDTEGDVLIFMPGAYEISRTIGAIRHSRVGGDFVILPLHGELSVADQDAAVAQYPKRKVIVSTNVAETSLTIEGVRVVIDAGLAKIARFDPYRGINTLLVEKVSRASADQRAGRAGRTAPGVALRLWSEREHLERPAQELPEVKRLDLAEVVLTLKASGVDDVAAFRWLEPPDARSLERAETVLRDLGALDNTTGIITDTGRSMLAFPLHPRYARMLLAAKEYDCVREAALVAALTQGRNLMRRGGDKATDEARERALGEEHTSDLFLLMRAWQLARDNGEIARSIGVNSMAAREAGQLADQFLRIARAEGLPLSDRPAEPEAIAKCVLAGFPDQVAVRLDTGTLRCALVHGRKGVLARESVAHKAPLLVVGEVREISGKDGVQTLLTLATAIREEWLRELFPDAFSQHFEVFYDKTLRRVMARRETRFHDLILKSELTDKTPPGEAASYLAREVLAGNCPLAHWDHAVDQWIVRLNRLCEWMPELQLPPLGSEDRAALIEQICYGAATYKEIKDRAVWPVVKSWLSSQQEAMLEKFAPERLEMPNGRKFKITYEEKGQPTIAVRIQDLYGVEQSLPIAAGRVPVTIQVLAPNHRPIQVTQNLANFWKESYPTIKQELQRKYPKHLWK